MIFVSPQPNKWYAIYHVLKAHWENGARNGMPPPMALVLSGWTMSSDFEKQDRWNFTLNWAEENNCGHLIPDLKEEEKYFVTQLANYTHYYHGTTLPKAYKPTKDQISNALKKLNDEWKVLLDDDFSTNTSPISFSGKKSRKLLVTYKSGYLPPWGAWTDHLANGRPSKFTELRSKVNELIAPMGIDHIIFKADP